MYKPAGTTTEQSIESGSGYQTHLIDSFIEEHKVLLDGLDNARQFIARSKLDDFARELKVFKGRFQSHIMAENVKLYLYLRLFLSNNSVQRQYANEMRKSMKPISEKVSEFFEKYGEGKLTSVAIYACETELNQLRKLIRDRFEEEEKRLYPLYKKNPA